ncbi:MAG: hypothetical protein HC936_15815 [Leptolyngbyaceae cyanobacterium SU_3_3]|nr:hypothetical protein [Leptolyngbyaceae cyanobacterium SU_3_3]
MTERLKIWANQEKSTKETEIFVRNRLRLPQYSYRGMCHHCELVCAIAPKNLWTADRRRATARSPPVGSLLRVKSSVKYEGGMIDQTH